MNFIIICCLLSGINNAQWRNATPYGTGVKDMQFTDRLTGYICGGAQSVGNCTGTGWLMKTIDAGKNWVRYQTVSGSNLTDLYFIDSYTGWLIGSASSVLRTTDGGVNWTVQSTGVGAGLNDICFVNASTGVVIGNNGLIRKSVNGGASWTTLPSGTTATLNAIYMVNSSVWYIAGSSGAVLKTTNGGTSFQDVYSGSSGFRDLWFSDENNGFLLANGLLLKTTDGGANWITIPTNPAWSMYKIHFINAQTGFISGDVGLVIKTTDGGNTWTNISTGEPETWASLYFIDEYNGYTGGNIGRISKTINGGQEWTGILSGFGVQINMLNFTGREQGLACGNNGGLFYTANGGLTWGKRYLNTTANLTAVKWVNHRKAYLASNFLLTTSDSGYHWQPVTGIDRFILDMHIVDSNSYFMTYGYGKVLRSLDAGITWDSLSLSSTVPFEGIFFLNPDTGFVAGANEVHRTYDGGNTWTLLANGIGINSSFNDIWFTSTNIGYVGGTFGKLYKTTDGGDNWVAMYPPGSTNIGIEEMEFINDSTGYFAQSVSQAITINGGIHVGSMSTACLFSNAPTYTINMPQEGFGYAAGGLNGVFHTLQPFQIWSCYLQDSVFCTGSKLFVGFHMSGLLINNETVQVELSDAAGSFNNPTVIGSLDLPFPTIDASSIVTCTLPAGVSGNGYRIRVVCLNPSLTGPDNGYNITIQNSYTPQVSLITVSQGTCSGQTSVFQAHAQHAGINPTWLWQLNGVPLVWNAGIISFDTLSGINTLTVQLESTLSCTINGNYTDTLVFSISTSPLAEAGSDTAICPGAYVQLSGSGNGLPDWQPPTGLSSTQILNPYAAPSYSTDYILTITDSAGCSGSDTVTVTILPTAGLSLNGPSAVCAGDSVLITAVTDSLVNINWTAQPGLQVINNNLALLIPSLTTDIIAATFGSSLCNDIDTFHIEVFPSPATPLLYQSGSILVLSTANNAISWFYNGALLSETNDTLYNPQNGNYVALITDGNGCTAYSDTVAFLNVGMDVPVSANNLVAFYKEGQVWVQWLASPATLQKISITDIRGSLVHQEQVNESSRTVVKLSSVLTPGLYLLQGEMSDGSLYSVKMLITSY